MKDMDKKEMDKLDLLDEVSPHFFSFKTQESSFMITLTNPNGLIYPLTVISQATYHTRMAKESYRECPNNITNNIVKMVLNSFGPLQTWEREYVDGVEETDNSS